MESLHFNLIERTEAEAFGHLLAALNQNGVPYSLHQNEMRVEVRIGKGF